MSLIKCILCHQRFYDKNPREIYCESCKLNRKQVNYSDKINSNIYNRKTFLE